MDGDVIGYVKDTYMDYMNSYTRPSTNLWTVKLSSDGELLYSECNSNRIISVNKDVYAEFDDGSKIFILKNFAPSKYNVHGVQTEYFTMYLFK